MNLSNAYNLSYSGNSLVSIKTDSDAALHTVMICSS